MVVVYGISICYNHYVSPQGGVLSLSKKFMSAMDKVIDPKKKFKVRGIVKETLPATKFIVEIDLKGEKHEIMAHISGKMRMHYIKLLVGDEVEVEMTPYDLTKGRITYRY